jgi:hypothetical protein
MKRAREESKLRLSALPMDAYDSILAFLPYAEEELEECGSCELEFCRDCARDVLSWCDHDDELQCLKCIYAAMYAAFYL